MFVFQKINGLCFLVTPILRLALLPYYRLFHLISVRITVFYAVKVY